MREFPFNEIKQGRHLTVRKLILTTFYGEIYHAKGINSIVDTVRHYLSSDVVDTIDGLGNRDGLKVKFFNADTAIIAGYIYSSGKKQQDTSGHYFTNDTSYYYLSFDCGKTLQLKTLAITKDAPEWINNIYINSKGECWMCFGQGSIWYSNDYWQSFQLLNTIIYDELDNDESETEDEEDKTFDDWFDRVNLDYIVMKNSNEGIALRQFVEDYKNKEWIFYTKDNWKTYNIWKDSNDFALWSEEYDTTTSYALYYDEYTKETQAKRNKHTFIVTKRFLKTSTASDKKRIYFVRTGTREI